MKITEIQSADNLIKIVRPSDYEKCSSLEIIKVFDEDIAQVTAPGATVLYACVQGGFDELLSRIGELPKADKMIVYTLQNPDSFDEDELDRMTKCLDTFTRGKTAYGLKMTGKFSPQFHIFLRVKD